MKYILTVLVVLSLTTCNTRPSEQKPPTVAAKPTIEVPDFNADSAYAFTAAQIAFGPRVPNTTAHQACFSYLYAKLGEYCDTVISQPGKARAWNGTTLNFKNIIGVFNPSATHRILLAAHWDTRPYADNDADPSVHQTPIDGANDAASAVGVLLEIARQLQINDINIGVDIIFFDAEDYGEPRGTSGIDGEFWCLGSQHWAKKPHTLGYDAKFGILLDMVGVPEARYFMEGTSMYYAPDVMRRVWDMAASAGYDRYFIKRESPPIIDDHLYVNRILGIPTIDIIHHEEGSSTGFFEHWHTVTDNLENVDKNSLKAAGQVVLYVIYYENIPAS